MLDAMHARRAALVGWRATAVLMAAAASLAVVPGRATAALDGGRMPARVISSALPEAPAIAIDAHGTAVLAHADARGAWVARLGRDGRPGRRLHVPGPAAVPGSASVALADGGAVTLTWLTAAQPSRRVVASWTLGGAPARAVAVSRRDWEPGAAAMIATAHGRAVLAWTELGPPPGIPRPMTVMVAVVAPGRSATVRQLARSAQQRFARPAVGADARGRATVSWTVEGWVGGGSAVLSTSSSVSAVRFAPAGAPLVSSLDGSSLEDLQVLTEPGGEQIAVWRVVDAAGNGRVMVAERVRGAMFSAPRQLATGRRISGLRATAGAGGDVAVAWMATVGRLTPAFAAVRSLGGRWGAVQTVTAPGRSGAGPAVAVDRHGRPLVVWASIYGAVAARAQRGTPFGQRQTISTPRGRLCVESRLVGGAGGHAVASFVCSAGSREPLHELARFWP